MLIALAVLSSLIQNPIELKPGRDIQLLKKEFIVNCVAVGDELCYNGGDPEDSLLTYVIRRDGKTIRPLPKIPFEYFAGGAGRIYESRDGHINIYNLQGKRLRSFGSIGSKPNQFGRDGKVWDEDKEGPQYLAVGPNGDVFGYDQQSSTIKHFDKNGKFLGSFAHTLLKDRTVEGMSVDSANNVFVSTFKYDRSDANLLKVSASGKMLASIGSLGEGLNHWTKSDSDPEREIGPGCLALAWNGNIFAVDINSDQIRVLDKAGKPLRAFVIMYGENIAHITSLSIDKRGTIFIGTSQALYSWKPQRP